MLPEVATLIGGAVSATSGLVAQHMANKRNKQESELAYRRQQQQIAQQNQYNSPAEQVSRLRAAGLNPNNAYGAEGSTVGNQESAAEYEPTQYSPVVNPGTGQASEMINALVGLREQRNKDALAIAEQALKSGQTFQAVMSGELSAMEKRQISELLDLQKTDYQVRIAKNEQDIEESIKRCQNINQQIDESKKRMKLTDKEIQELDSIITLNGIKGSEILALLPARVRNMDADTFLKYIQADEGKVMLKNIEEQTVNLGFYRYMERQKFALENSKFDFNVTTWNKGLEQWRIEQRNQNLRWAGTELLGIAKVGILGSSYARGQQLGKPDIVYEPTKVPSPVQIPNGSVNIPNIRQ